MWDTIRWLRLTQLIGRLKNNFYTPSLNAIVEVSPRALSENWQMPSARSASFSDDGTPEFLNTKGKLRSKTDWDDASMPRLWRYNLHYFDDLNAYDASTRRNLHERLISQWIDQNPAPVGTGWEPYPCSLRIVNWIKWALAGNELSPAWQRSLAIQSSWLAKNIEWHLLGNHLFANAKALVFAGVFFEGNEASDWLAKGLRILRRELPEQVLADGGQFERSPMYHLLATEDLLDLINLASAYPGTIAPEDQDSRVQVAKRMLRWAAVMRHPDESIVLFNDSAFGIAPEVREILDYAVRLGIDFDAASAGLTYLEDSGYVRAAAGEAVLFADIGLIGPDYLPGHAHADTLGFEFSLFGQRWFVDAGCSLYEACDERLRQRGTAAHNTVLVDGENSSEVWSSFRVARRARPIDVAVDSENGVHTITAGHDGYRRLPGKVTHYRTFQMGARRLAIIDRLAGRFQSAQANFLLHPDVSVSVESETLTLARDSHNARICFEGGRVEILDSTWHPEFGLTIPTKKIAVTLTGNRLVTELTW